MLTFVLVIITFVIGFVTDKSNIFYFKFISMFLRIFFGCATLLASTLQAQTLFVTAQKMAIYLKYESTALKTFKYSALPYPSGSASVLNDVPRVAPTFNTEKKRGYFYVRTAQDSTATKFASIFTNTGARPTRVLLYVVGTEAYSRAMKDYFLNTYILLKGKKANFKFFYYPNDTHNDNTLKAFKDSIKIGDAIIFCHQQTANILYTDKEKQGDGAILLDTKAQHIVRLYEHYNIKQMGDRTGATVTDTHRLWFGMGTNIQDVFIDHTEATAAASAYFTAQCDRLKSVNDWQAIAKGLSDKDTKVRIWADGVQSKSIKPAQK
jgi:hypothetical protein